MVVDTSVVISILKGEPGSVEFHTAIVAAEAPLIGAPNLFEASMVFVSQANGDLEEIGAFYSGLGIRIVPFARRNTATPPKPSAVTARGGIRRG